MDYSRQTGDATVYDSYCLFWGVVINTNGSANGVLTVYDGNPGSIVFAMTCVGADYSYGALFRKAILCETSLRIEFSGTGANVIVYYQREY